MTAKEALKAWEKFYAEIDKENGLFVGTINPEMVSPAIEALKYKIDDDERVKAGWAKGWQRSWD